MLSLFNILEANYWAQVPQYTESLRLATCGQKDFMAFISNCSSVSQNISTLVATLPLVLFNLKNKPVLWELF